MTDDRWLMTENRPLRMPSIPPPSLWYTGLVYRGAGRIAALLLVALAALTCACLEGPLRCADGRICPRDMLCSDGPFGCVTPQQVDACLGKGELAACEVLGSAGKCRSEACVPFSCGDGEVQAGEQCDGSDPNGVNDCTEAGFYLSQPLECRDNCTVDTGACSQFCGDELVNGEEECDGSIPIGLDCLSFGYDVGPVTCGSSCQRNLDACRTIGWRETSLSGFSLMDIVGTGPGDVSGSGKRVGGAGQLAPNAKLYHRSGATWEPTDVQTNDGSAYGQARRVVVEPDGRLAAIAVEVISDVAMNWDLLRQTDESWALVRSFSEEILNLWSSPSGLVLTDSAGNIHELLDDEWVTTNWLDKPLKDLHGLDDMVWAVGDTTLLHRSDGVWTTAALPEEDGTRYSVVWASDSEHIFVGGSNAIGWRFAIGAPGAWTTKQLPPEAGLSALLPTGLWGASGDFVIAVGRGGTSKLHDGVRWTESGLGSPSNVNYTAVWGSGPGDVYVASDVGVVSHFQGLTWVTNQPGGHSDNRTLNGAWSDREVFYVVGDDGALWRLADEWEPVSHPASFDLAAIWGSGADDIWAVGEDGFLHYSEGEWTVGETGWHRTGIVGDGPGNIWAVGKACEVSHYDGGAWNHAFLPAELCVEAEVHGVSMDDEGRVYFTIEGWLLWRDPAGGWNSVELPKINPSKPWQARTVWATGDGVVFLAGDNGIAFRYHDGTLEALPVLTGRSYRAIWGTGPDDVFLAGTSGTISHYDGANLLRVRAPDENLSLLGVAGARSTVLFVGALGAAHRLIRPVPVGVQPSRGRRALRRCHRQRLRRHHR